MKKFLSVILALTLSLAALPVFASAEDALNIIAVSDVHYDPVKSFAPLNTQANDIDEFYSHATSLGLMRAESRAVIDAFLNKAAESPAEYILISGDLVDAGTLSNHQALAAIFTEFEARTGKEIFVIDGNHDVTSTTTEQFKSIYADFGYNQALTVDTETCSYTAELGKDYRLIAIDSCKSGKTGDAYSEALINWIDSQAQQAKSDGKKLIAITHHNIFEHFLTQKTFVKDFVVNPEWNLGDRFAEWGIKYTFSGHIHFNDIGEYKAANGETIYETVSSCLVTYPITYRNVSFADSGVNITTSLVDGIDTALLPEGFTDEQLELISSDINAYSKGYFNTGLKITVLDYLNAGMISNLLSLTAEENPGLTAVINSAIPRFKAALCMPLYKSMAGDGQSIEALAELYGTTLAVGNYETPLDIFCYFADIFNAGDEYAPSYSTERKIINSVLAVVINYALAEVSDAQFAAALTELAAKFNVGIPENVFTSATTLAGRLDGIELLVVYGLNPILDDIVMDSYPKDNSASLPAYGSEEVTAVKALTFIEKLIDRLYSVIRLLLRFLGIEK